MLKFYLNDRVVELPNCAPDRLLLDYIREVQRLTGTKEGCAEGDCGACTVLVGSLKNGQLRYKSVNACIQFLPSLNAKHIVTIEALANGSLAPLQKAMVEHHGSQCGFCTPGFMMSLFGLLMDNTAPTEKEIEVALQGNLCRCTGYGPIIKAALSVAGDLTCQKWLAAQRASMTEKLKAMQPIAMVEIHSPKGQAFLPRTSDELASVLAAHPKATIVAGATDVGLWVAKHFASIAPAIFLNDMEDMSEISGDDGLRLGAMVSYASALDALGQHHPAFTQLLHRIGGAQIRNAGTIGGNIANGSPIGDMPPALIALGADVHLGSAQGGRSLPLESFFIDYGKQDLAEGEFVKAISLPPIATNQRIAFYKISKRRDEDISTVMAAFNITVDQGIIQAARICFGGMAGTPKRAHAAEAVLQNQPWSEESFIAAAQALPEDFAPLSDWRASAEYRMAVSQNLFRRFFLDQVAGGQSHAA